MDISTIDPMYLLAAYGLMCIVVTVIASQRGWNAIGVLFTCVLATPLIAAIMFAPHYQNIDDKQETA